MSPVRNSCRHDFTKPAPGQVPNQLPAGRKRKARERVRDHTWQREVAGSIPAIGSRSEKQTVEGRQELPRKLSNYFFQSVRGTFNVIVKYPAASGKRTNGSTENGHTGRRTTTRTNGRLHGQTDGHMGKRTAIWANGRPNGQTDGHMGKEDGHMGTRANGRPLHIAVFEMNQKPTAPVRFTPKQEHTDHAIPFVLCDGPHHSPFVFFSFFFKNLSSWKFVTR